MNVILSIKPQYARAILNGEKKVEFRKNSFKKKVNKIFIYSSAPDQVLLGYFSIKNIDIDSPIQLWKKYSNVGCIEKKDFFEYYSNKSQGTSLIIDKVVKFNKPIEPNKVFENFYPPQSFQYCSVDLK